MASSSSRCRRPDRSGARTTCTCCDCDGPSCERTRMTTASPPFPSPSPSAGGKKMRRKRPSSAAASAAASASVSAATTSRLACTVACLVAHTCTMSGSAAAGLRSSAAPTPADDEESAVSVPSVVASSFPLVVRTKHASVGAADDVLFPLNLDIMGRGRHLDVDHDDNDNLVNDLETAHHRYTYERDVLLHSLQDWTTLREAVGSDGLEIDQDHTELFHSRSGDAQHIQDGNEGQGEGSDRHLGSAVTPSNNQYETMAYFPCYRTVQGTYDTMYELQRQRPDLVTVEPIGESFKGESILMLKITGPESDGSPIAAREPAVFTSGVHAREYAPPEIATRFAEHLVTHYGTDADVTAILDHTALHFVLQSNPDSRRIAETNYANSQPRKNQRSVDGCSASSQWGTDLNRNFDFQHGSPGASNSPCNILYHGKGGGSEGETQAIQNLSRRVFPEWQRKAEAEDDAFKAAPDTARGLYVDIHSYGRDIIFPYGYQNQEVGNIDAFKSMSHKICSINNYDPSGSGYYFLGRTSGDTLDYHYGALGVASILYEVGNSWAESCNAFENSVFPSNFDALLYTTKLAMTPYRTSLGPDVMSIDVAVSEDGDQVTITADVSDYAMTELSGKKQLSTAVQTIRSVKAYLGSHPYDAYPSQPLLMKPSGGSFNSHTESVSLSIDTSSIDGRHTICLVASDTDGYDGTVSCEYIDIPVKADATLTPQEQGGAITDEEPTTEDTNSTNVAELASNETNSTAVASTETIPGDIASRNNDVCPKIPSEEVCNNVDSCRWRKNINKSKCVNLCQGRQNERKCLKHSMCQWDSNMSKCSRK